jgi:hypothetical protein
MKDARETRRAIVASLLAQAIRIAVEDHHHTEDYEAIVSQILAELGEHGGTQEQLRSVLVQGAWDLGRLGRVLCEYVDTMDTLSKMGGDPLVTLGPGGGYTRDIHARNKDGADG